MARPRVDPLTRFEPKVKVVESGCHEWQGGLHRMGYGKFSFPPNPGDLRHPTVPAHRAAWLLKVGPIPDGLWVLHKCDNRKCVNIEHLYVGTPKQNVRDKIDRCKWYGQMKYSADAIEQCKKLFSEGMTQTAIGKLLGINQTSVSRFVRNKYRPRI